MLRLLQTASPVALAAVMALVTALALPVMAQDAAPEEPAAGAAPEPAPADAAPADAAPADPAPVDAAPAEPAPAETAPEAAPAVPAEAPTRSSVVASVNGTDITLGEVIIAASQLPPQYQQLPPDVLFSGVTDQLVQQELLAQSVTAAPARVDLALANERRSLLAGEAITTLSETILTDEAVQAAYDATYGDAEPQTEWSASHILVATAEEAEAVVARLEAGEDFAALATELSTDTGSGAQGGSLGFFGPGMMVPEFEEAVSTLAVGAVSAPVESQFGFHVIRLDETRPLAAPALEEVRGEISERLRQEAIEARLLELEVSAQVVRPEPGAFDPAVLGNLSLLAD